MQTDGSPREKVQSGKCVWRAGGRYQTSPHLLGQPEIEETRLLACARFTATPLFQSGACKLPFRTGCETTTALSNKLPVVKSLTNCVNKKKHKSWWICQNPLQTYDPINKNPVKITMVLGYVARNPTTRSVNPTDVLRNIENWRTSIQKLNELTNWIPIQEDIKTAFASLIAPVVEHVSELELNRKLIERNSYPSINTTDAHVCKYIAGIQEEILKLPRSTQWKNPSRDRMPRANAIEEAYHEEADSQEQQQEYQEEGYDAYSQEQDYVEEADEGYDAENWHEEVYGPYDKETYPEETQEEGYAEEAEGYDDETYQEEWDGDDAYQDQEEGYDDEAYEGYDDGTYEEEGYDNEAYDQEEGYDDEAYDQEEGYDDEAYEQEEGYDDEAYMIKKKPTMMKPMIKKKATMRKPMNKKKATMMKPMQKKKVTRTKPMKVTRTKLMKATPTKPAKKNGTATKPPKIKNKNGTAMKPKPMKKILANMGNAYSLLVQKAAGGVTCANIGTIATQVRVNHSRHQTEVGDGTVGFAEANRGAGRILQQSAYSR